MNTEKKPKTEKSESDVAIQASRIIGKLIDRASEAGMTVEIPDGGARLELTDYGPYSNTTYGVESGQQTGQKLTINKKQHSRPSYLNTKNVITIKPKEESIVALQNDGEYDYRILSGSQKQDAVKSVPLVLAKARAHVAETEIQRQD